MSPSPSRVGFLADEVYSPGVNRGNNMLHTTFFRENQGCICAAQHRLFGLDGA